MDTSGFVFACTLLAFYFRLFDFKFKRSPTSGVVVVGFAPWTQVVVKTVVVVSPIIVRPQMPPDHWVTQTLGFVGLALLLGPASIRPSAVQVRPISNRTVWGNVKSYIFNSLDDKRVSLQNLLWAFLIASVVKLFGWSLPLDKIVVHIPVFNNPDFSLDDSIPSSTAWMVVMFSLYLKTVITPTSVKYKFAMFVLSVPVATEAISFAIQYAHFVELHRHALWAWIVGVLFHHF